MLPTMRPLVPSRTKRARATKSFEEVRVGRVRLYFSQWELIGFQLDGQPPVVCAPPTATADPGDRRLRLESDPSRWVPRAEFERRWEEDAGAK